MFGHTYIFFDSINSTNDYAKENINIFEHGSIIRTAHQTAGRGQRGKQWISCDGENIFMTIILKPEYRGKIEKAYIEKIILFSAKAVQKVIKDSYGLDARIQMPNDIYIKDKKIAGVLVEAITQGNVLKGLVAGIGLNCNTLDLPGNISTTATSLEIEYGKKINVDVCFSKLVENCEVFYGKMVTKSI
ncbi:MAG: biotin--[acetyl-CoA-carboxylase] ligase [Candidatus Margulisiibacteriota bacterium]|nr:MAG: biotin--[acetyl-CoA-carboxylase] ligase [Candidatus Margulisbacteria bacterium GWD2_39_127]OGI03722.1 MAG: biotin--[acetyl-CoA-carboxylase] ligase [Candidatus Margulisbacteria bacterium GWF2_38_17]OGI06842.1 MAG: biotin--[acetyl-CoA-carboxylase] ligase [Candidatus Margulisbacteria bacterium GWE2_39_32]PZM77063.1 MAG: biotin--[acetyl-CoA-carboxylase] ligase [Candidatus Margulisiibacteriota bacterium]HAR64437.1 biotin--[acetyl-CoA-carboxylase] ligase [Candidatus Margulisiibacteriota bacte